MTSRRERPAGLLLIFDVFIINEEVLHFISGHLPPFLSEFIVRITTATLYLLFVSINRYTLLHVNELEIK